MPIKQHGNVRVVRNLHETRHVGLEFSDWRNRRHASCSGSSEKTFELKSDRNTTDGGPESNTAAYNCDVLVMHD